MPVAKIKTKTNHAKDCFILIWLGQVTVYNTNPLNLRFKRDFGRTVLFAELYQRSNIMAVVFYDQPGKVFIWDDNKEKMVEGAEIDTFMPIVNIHFRDQYLVIFLEKYICVYSADPIQLLYKHGTDPNPKGIGDLLTHSSMKDCLLIVNSNGDGSFQLSKYNNANHQSFSVNTRISAHQNKIDCMGFWSGFRGDKPYQIVITASQRGTVIRLWRIETSSLVQEFRRGLETTHITSLCMSPSGCVLAVLGGTGKVHLYNVDLDANSEPKGVLGYFGSNVSDLQIPCDRESSVIQFNDQEIILMNETGKYTKYAYNMSANPAGYRCLESIQL